MNELIHAITDAVANHLHGADAVDDCNSCAEEMPEGDCSKSQRPCGHHCNHSWTHDACCWCGQEWGEEALEAPEALTEGHEPNCHCEACGQAWLKAIYEKALEAE
jgi:hypothetical protein